MAAVHFRLQCESFKNLFDGILYFNSFQMSTVTASGNEYSLKISVAVS